MGGLDRGRCADQGYARASIETPELSFRNELVNHKGFELNTDVNPACSGSAHTKITRAGSDFIVETGL